MQKAAKPAKLWKSMEPEEPLLIESTEPTESAESAEPTESAESTAYSHDVVSEKASGVILDRLAALEKNQKLVLTAINNLAKSMKVAHKASAHNDEILKATLHIMRKESGNKIKKEEAEEDKEQLPQKRLDNSLEFVLHGIRYLMETQDPSEVGIRARHLIVHLVRRKLE